MAISSIISFGFGNGTFTPGVGKLPTLGYSVLPFVEVDSLSQAIESDVFISGQFESANYIAALVTNEDARL